MGSGEQVSLKANFIAGTKWAFVGSFNRGAKDLIFQSTKLFLEQILSCKG